MINSRKHQLVVVVILACICSLAFGTEPNCTKPEPEFQINNQKQNLIGMTTQTRNLLKATHVAVVYIGHKQNFPDFSSPGVIKLIVSTSAGKALSPEQIALLQASGIVRIGKFGADLNNHYHFRVYGVNEKETHKTIEAFLEVLTDEANSERQVYLNELDDLEKMYDEAKKKIPDKEAELAEVEAKYQKVYKSRMPYAGEGAAIDAARKNMSELKKDLDGLMIKFAEMRAKLQALDEALKSLKTKEKESSPEGRQILTKAINRYELMMIDLTIEIKAAEAKRSMTERLFAVESNFCNLYREKNQLSSQLRDLRKNLEGIPDDIRGFEEELMDPDRLPPAVFQNKVTIYPVKLDD